MGAKGNRIWLCIAAIFWLGLFGVPDLMARTGFTPPKRVLLLNSYHKGYGWTDEITRGVEDTLAGREIELHIEYLDTKRHSGYLYQTYLTKLLSLKHIKHPYDAVITSDSKAFYFLREHKKVVARNSPHVFCGVNFLTPADMAGKSGMTGVIEQADISANIDLIRRLHPGTRTVLVVTDNTPMGRMVQKEVAGIRDHYQPGLLVNLAFDLSLEELGRRLRSLNAGAVVLFTFFSRDNTHRYFDPDVTSRYVAEQAPVPVYCAWCFSLGSGIMGGYMVDAYSQGATAAKKVVRILEGTPVDQIPIQWVTPMALRFDYRQLVRHDLDAAELPSGAEVLFQPVSFYFQHKALIWNLALVFVLLFLACAGAFYGLVRARRSERKMEKSRSLHQSLFEKTNDAIFILDGRTGRCLDANQPALDITGRGLDELRQMSVKDISPESAAKWLASERPGNRAVDLGQVAYLTRDNTQRVARVSSVYIDEATVMGIAKDITHDIEMEKQLRQSQKMEAIGTLAGGIAHDFNNILSAILSYAQLALINVNDPLKVIPHIDQVIKGAKRASQLVHQILTFSRQTESRIIRFQLGSVVKEAIKFLRSSIPSSIEIHSEIRSQAMVRADATQVHQVMMNLCTNAYHAMRQTGGTLFVVLEDLTLSNADLAAGEGMPGPYVRLEIRDTGHGMDASTLTKIFDPYFTTKKPGKGTGLGLSVVVGIIEQHQGFIRVDSRVNRGTRFEIFWPADGREDEADVVHEEVGDDARGQGRLLVVDDEPGILRAMKALLENRGYEVAVMSDPLGALALFKADPKAFDLVITDMTMPKMTGIRLAEEIMAMRSTVPVILCTGFHNSLSKSEAMAMGIEKLLYKPVLPTDLYRAVGDVLGLKKTGPHPDRVN